MPRKRMKENLPRYLKQYAVGVVDYSSQYGGENPRSFSYSVSNLIGEPRIFPKYGDFTQAAVMRTYGPWWDRCQKPAYKKDTRPKSTAFHSQDYIDLIFEQPVYPWSIAIYETYNPGAVVRILALCQEFPKQKAPSDENSNSESVDPDILGKAIPLPLIDKYTHWEVLWSCAKPQSGTIKEARMFAPILREIQYRSRIIRLEFCHKNLDYYTELDAVELTGTLNYSCSSPVDPPTSSMSLLSLSPSISPSSSSEELAYAESKVDYHSSESELTEDAENTSVDENIVSDDLHTGYFCLLPTEIISKIFSYLPFPDFCRASCVCKLFHMHSYDPSQLSCIDLHSHWHMINNNALGSIKSRFNNHHKQQGFIQTLDMRWLGSGDIVTPQQLTNFIQSCDFGMLAYLNLASSSSVTDHVLHAVAKCMPNLNFLDIQSCDKASAEGIRILHKLNNLEVLNLYRTKVDDAGIICIIHANQNLVSVNLGSCQRIRDYDRVLLELSEHCANLRVLDTWRARSLTSHGLKALTSQCRYLEELDFGWCGTLQSSSGCFSHLAKSCPNLKKLFLTTNRTVSDTEVNLFAKHCPDLRQLDILGTRMVSRVSIENLLYNCRDLEFLDVSFCFAFNVDVVESLRQAYPRVAIKRSFQD